MVYLPSKSENCSSYTHPQKGSKKTTTKRQTCKQLPIIVPYNFCPYFPKYWKNVFTNDYLSF